MWLKLFKYFLLIPALLLNSCNKEPERAFYYWKTVFSLSQKLEENLADLHITKLYVRFFDVAMDDATLKPKPIAKIKFAEEIPANIKVVPVVYIVNKTLANLKPFEINTLAGNIFALVDTIAKTNNIDYSELQLDCDWTESTKTNYFRLLEIIKGKLRNRSVLLSATIRFHQVKYRYKTGIPDVDRGMLMFYNLGKLEVNSGKNSIYNTEDASKYVSYCSDYPLPLDVALPAFTWGIHIRNNKILGLLNGNNVSDFENNSNFSSVSENVFTPVNSFFFRGTYFMKEDRIRIETITPQICLSAAQQLSKYVKLSGNTVSIYHLDSLIFQQYDQQSFEKVFAAFR